MCHETRNNAGGTPIHRNARATAVVYRHASAAQGKGFTPNYDNDLASTKQDGAGAAPSILPSPLPHIVVINCNRTTLVALRLQRTVSKHVLVASDIDVGDVGRRRFALSSRRKK